MPTRKAKRQAKKKTEVPDNVVTVPTLSALRSYEALDEYVVKEPADGGEEVSAFRKDDWFVIFLFP